MGKKSLAALLCATMAMTACMLPATAAMADEPLKIEFFQQKGCRNSSYIQNFFW